MSVSSGPAAPAQGPSGDALAWTDRQRGLVREAIALYRKAAPVISAGWSFRHGPAVDSYRHPVGWQGIVRTNGTRTLVVVHTFANPGAFSIPLPQGEWVEDAMWGELNPTHASGQLKFGRPPAFAAAILLLHRKN